MARSASFRTKLLVAFVGLAVGTAAAVLHQAWRHAREAQLEELQELLKATTAAIAPGIDGDAHAALDPGASDVARQPAWLELARVAARLKASSALFQEVYTISVLNEREPGVGRFVYAEKKAEVGKDYKYSRFPCMVRGLAGPCADTEIVEDEYGTTLSGYAPIHDRSGRTVALLGVDVDGSTVHAMRGKLLGILALGALGAALAGAVVAWFFASRISRPIEALTVGFDRVAEGDYDTRVRWDKPDEFGRLAGQFNRMVEGLGERQRLKQALHIAMEIQQNLLPATAPSVDGVDLAGFSDYCDETGGDYFDYPRTWAMPGGRVALTIGDVTGHGIGAALLMAAGRAVLRSHSDRDISPGELLSIANRHLARDATQGKFMTLFYGVLDPVHGTLTFANGGQGGTFVVRAASGTVEVMEASAPPLGVIDGIPFADATVEGIRPGDVVVLGTDGIWETLDAAGEQFGMERFHALAVAHAKEGAVAISRAIRAAVEAHLGAGSQADDVTLIVAKLDPAAKTATATS